jgi:hypothetical protein
MAAMLIVATLVFLLFAPFIAWPQQTKGYTFHRTGYPKSIETMITGINDHPAGRGDIVGQYTTRDHQHHPFMRFGATHHTIDFQEFCTAELQGLNEHTVLPPVATNNHRLLGGTVCPPTLGENNIYREGFVYTGSSPDHPEERVDIIRFPGAMYTYVQGLDDGGTVVGSYEGAEQPPHQGAFILADGVYTALPPVEGYSVWATDINNHGQIVGTIYPNVSGAAQGFVFANGAYDFFAFPQDGYGTVSGINDHGHIVGSFWTYEYHDDELLCCWRGFLLKDGMYTIINATNDAQTTPAGINNRGVIAGTHYRPIIEPYAPGGVYRWLAHGFWAIPKPVKVVKK